MTIAPYARIHDRWRGIPVDYYVYHEDSALARPLFGYTPDIIETYTKLTGVRYPWAKYAQATVADFFGGEENGERDRARGLAPGQARVRRPALVPLAARSARARAPVVRRR